ncbi:FkbM family methyltransferase, partial [Methylocystis suflitae]|uniref:FkbM family methyltransferase n=1 Tax=Methylocystis suflitae TaxID=2951405 RepID=UPI00210A1C8C
LARDSRVIIDVGAHHGLYALMARALNRSASIVAFEPNERVFQVMTENIALNRFVITEEKLAVSDSSGEATFYDLPGDQPVAASLDAEVARLRPDFVPTSVRTTRLDQYIDDRGIGAPDLIKIDVER